MAFVATVSSSVTDATTLDRIKFPYSPISYHSLPWLIAYEAKLFEKHGLEVDPVFAGASSLIVQSMLAGEADLAGMAGPAVISNVLKGGDVIQVAALVKSFSVPLYVQPAITQIAQLAGKRVGVTRFGSVSHFTAKAILDRSNVNDAVIIQTGGYPESMTALSTNAIAGAMIPAPQSVVLREKGFRELVSIKQIRDMNIRFIEQGIVARRGFAEKNGEIVKRFISAVSNGLKLLHDDKTFATKVLSKYTKVTRQNMLDESYRASVDAFAKDLHVPADVFKDLAEQLVGLKLIDPVAAQKTPLSAYYDNRYVDELEKSGFFKRLWQ
jgi:ABC-type nitrate/sulfonate/bicarbonate transport system substrate-binding protein